MADAALLRCVSCRALMERTEELTHTSGQVHLELYQCQGESCRRKAALMWELDDGAMARSDAAEWLEREVKARGSFFPSDFR